MEEDNSTKIKVAGTYVSPFKDVLVFDIEGCKINPNGRIDADNIKHKIWGAYSYNTNKVYFGKGSNFQDLLNKHKIIVGHNIKSFDMPIMERDLGINFRNILPIDLLEVLRDPPTKQQRDMAKKQGKTPMYGKGRNRIIGEFRIIGMTDNRLPNLRLDTIAKHGNKIFKDNDIYSEFFKEYKVDDFDYTILNKEDITEDDWKYIKSYLKQDIVVTKNIFEFLERYFRPLAEYLPLKDIKNLEYIHAPTGKYAYKVICKELELLEEYDSATRDKFPGAFVFLPTQEEYTPIDGEGYCRDFTSQHPSHIHSSNLCTPIELCEHKVNGECPKPYSGDGTIFKLNGTYCGCKKGKIEEFISKLLHLKIHYKKVKDPREYTIKILINSVYGLLSSPIFKNTYYKHTGPDTTLMSKQSTQFMANWVTKHGYTVTYGDTDSIYIMDPFRDKDKMNTIIKNGVKQIKDAMPFSDDRYAMGIDAEFSHIFFFQDEKSKDKRFKKKNYIYITKDNKVKINGLPLLKRNAPKLAKLIYTNYLEKEILRTKKIKFDKGYLTQLINFELEKDINIVQNIISVNPAEAYATMSQINAQISVKYFDSKDGLFKGIKHLRKGYGVGKGKFYCSLEEAKDLKLRELDLDTVWNVLEPFVKRSKQTSLFNYE